MGKNSSHKEKAHKTKKYTLLEFSSRIIVKKSKDKIVTTLSNQMLKSILPKQTEDLNHF